MIKLIKDVMEYLPIDIKEEIEKLKEEQEKIEEIRVRVNQNLSLKIGQEMRCTSHKITKQEIEEIEEIFENICEKLIYSYTRQIAEGFITIKGGNRVGITGSCVIKNGKVENVNGVSSLNIRIAKQIKDASLPILKDVIDIENSSVFNTMIVSSPGAGKTTILRDLIRKISNRNARNRFPTKSMRNSR
mgnify:CR=1 FL=1